MKTHKVIKIIFTVFFIHLLLTNILYSQTKLAKYYFYKGSKELTAENYNNAINYFTKAIKEYPDYTKAYNDRGFAYSMLDNNNKAVKDFTKAIELKPDFPNAYLNRGNGYFFLKDYSHALKDWEKAIELDPDLESDLKELMMIAKMELR